MARQVSLQEVLAVIDGPLEENSLWALLLQSSIALKRTIQGHLDSCSEAPTLLVTPESVLLNHGGSVQILAGIAKTSSVFTPPEMKGNNDIINPEKCYIYALGMSLLSAMGNVQNQQMFEFEVGGSLQHIFNKMTKEESSLRPSLQEILIACRNQFESENQASDEVDRLVSYVFGSTFEHYSDGEELDIEEADLEAEIKEVMNMKEISGVENLYPLSYESRASSSLSLGSVGVYHQSFSSTTARPHPDSPNMYSSLPVVFRSASRNAGLQLSGRVSSSKENGMLSEDCNNQLLSSRQTGYKCLYGSHFYTPSRRKKQTERIQDADPLFRSSSDGRTREVSSLLMTTHSLLLHDMPTLAPSGETAVAFHDSNSEVSLTPCGSERDAASKQCEITFDYSEPASSQLVAKPDAESGDDGDDFNFPSPPAIPSENKLPGIHEVGMSIPFVAPESNERTTKATASANTDQTESTEPPINNVDQLNGKESQFSDKNDQIRDKEGELCKKNCSVGMDANDSKENAAVQEIGTATIDRVPSNSMATKEVYKGSVGKLSKMLGPEFNSVRGFHVKEKVAMKIPFDRRVIGVVLLNGHVVQFVVEVISTCRELFNQVVAHQSLEETHIFGLTVLTVNCELFMELDQKLSKYAPKGWSNLNKSVRSQTWNFTVVFRVKYYVENVNQLSLSSTRHLYYLQLRKDILEGRTYCHEQSALKLAAYSLQAEWGDKLLASEDIRVEDYMHSKVISKLGKLNVRSILFDMHSELHGLNRKDAEQQYLMEAQTLPEYGMVFYEVAKTKHGKIGSILLGLSVRGIVVYDVHKGIKTPSSHWPWKKIKNLSYKDNRFILEVEESKFLNYFADTYKKAQYLLHLSINYHRFQLLPRLSLEQHEDDFLTGESTAIMPEGESFVVEMMKDENIIGLRLAGGKERAYGGGFIYVQSINKGSIADLQGKIKDGDILIKVNGESVWGLTHREAAEKILSTTAVTLNIHRPYNQHWAAVAITEIT